MSSETASTREEGWQLFTREVPFEVAEEGDGRTLIARIVPYNVVAKVADPPDWRSYSEVFMPGAFRTQINAANRINVLLNFNHRQGISDLIGRGMSLEDRSDGLHGTFRVFDHPDGDKALSLVRDGVMTGMSAEFAARRSKVVDGVTQRLDARVANVALCPAIDSPYAGPKAAYAGAEVLAVRHGEDDDTGEDEETETLVLPPLLPPSFDRLAKFGVEAPAWAVRKDN